MTHFVTYPDNTTSTGIDCRKSSKSFAFAVVAKYGNQPWCVLGYRVDEKQAQALLTQRLNFYSDRPDYEFKIVPAKVA